MKRINSIEFSKSKLSNSQKAIVRGGAEVPTGSPSTVEESTFYVFSDLNIYTDYTSDSDGVKVLPATNSISSR